MNIDNSDKVWAKDPTEHTIINYHLKQYNEEYESIKFIKNHLKNLSFNTIIDFGCGSGSLCFYLKQIKNVKFTGIDICQKVLDIAQTNNPDSIFVNINYKDMHNIYHLSISSMVLAIVNPTDIETFINKQFECSNKYVVFFSLFTDSELDINIKINDPYNNEVVYYNIVPVNKVNRIAENYGFKILVSENFEIEKHLSKPDRPGRGTYTIETINNKLLQFSDVIFMPWKIIILEKS